MPVFHDFGREIYPQRGVSTAFVLDGYGLRCFELRVLVVDVDAAIFGKCKFLLFLDVGDSVVHSAVLYLGLHCCGQQTEKVCFEE